MNHEKLTHLAKAKSPEKPAKSQTELRADLEQRLKSLKPSLQEGMEEYKQALKDNLFSDQDDEPEGSGEARKESMQRSLTILIDRAERMKVALDSNDPLPQSTPDLSTQYTHPDGQQETITLNIETKLQDFLSFYQKTNINLPPNFETIIKDIWQNNQTEIEQAIAQHGFDDMLLVPGNIPLTELKDKLTMESGYVTGANFDQGGGFAGAKSQNVDKPRIIIVHKTQNLKDRPELSQTLNTKGKDVKQNQALTLEDYIIFQRKYFDETSKHLDEDGWTWLATKSGARLVNSDWDSGHHQLCVDANDSENQDGNLGFRPARCFFWKSSLWVEDL